MKQEFVMLADEKEEMRKKAKVVKLTGIPSKNLPSTKYERRVKKVR